MKKLRKGKTDIKDKRAKIILHPGEILKQDFLDGLGISVYALSKAIGVPRSRINDIVLGRRGITADTAGRLGRSFGTDAESWSNLQKHYDLIIAQNKLARILPKIQTPDDLHTGA